MKNSVECLGRNECMQYCAVLAVLEGNDGMVPDPCDRPQQIEEDGINENSFSDPALAMKVSESLRRVLTLGGSVKETVDEDGNELSIALVQQALEWDARIVLWKQYVAASHSGRKLTDVEVEHYSERLREQAAASQKKVRDEGISSENMTFAQAILDRQSMDRDGLLLDNAMCRTVTELLSNANSGQPTLLIGDKGIAKTLVAKYVSGLFAPDGRPRFISGDGSLMKDEFIGKTELNVKDGATETVYNEGILVECMEQGIPLVIDEVNLIDPAIVMRLQDILLRKPGDTISLQEDGGRPITIKRGFTIFATANEASERYQSRAILDPAFRDRFDILPIEYPDGTVNILDTTHVPTALARLAYATVISPSGVVNPRVNPGDALWLARVAHASQQLYAKAPRDVNGTLPGSATASFVDNETPMLRDCITPRKMVELLKRVCDGTNPYDVEAGIQGVLYEAVGGMQHRSDRETIHTILQLLSSDVSVLQSPETKAKLRV